MATFPTRTDGEIIDSTWFNPLQSTVAAVSETTFYAEDFASIQAAIDAANTAGGGTVLIGPGTFDSELTIYDNIHLSGAGIDATVLRLPNATNGSAAITSDGFALLEGTDTPEGGIAGFTIANLSIDGNKANNTAGRGIQLYGSDFRLFQIYIRDAAGEGLYSEYATGGAPAGHTASSHVHSVKVLDSGSHGINWIGPHDSNLNAVTVARNVGSGLLLGDRAHGTQVVNSHSWGNTQDYAYRIQPNAVELISCQGEGAQLAQVLIDGPNAHIIGGIYYQAGTGSVWTGFEIASGIAGSTIITNARNLTDAIVKWSGTPTGTHYHRIHVSDGVTAIDGTPPPGANYEYLLSDGTILKNGPALLDLTDDFTSGSPALNVANAGELGWFTNNVGNLSIIDGETSHPGIYRRGTGTTSGTYAAFVLHDSAQRQTFPPSEFFDQTFIVRLNTNDLDTTMRIGLGQDARADPPNNGIYVEKLAADTSWFGVTRSASVETRTAALATITTGWLKVRIRRVDGSTIGFTLDNGTEVTATLNIPPSSGGTPFVAIGNNTSILDKTFDIDRFGLIVTGLVR